MNQKYNPQAIEQKWREYWQTSGLDKAVMDPEKAKYYTLVMFPYPSGEGLHVGHWRPYVLSDVWTRYQMMQGKEVLYPMGWDAFGLPAENRAIKQGIHPEESTNLAIMNMKRQLKETGALFDWDRELDTSKPDYYRWTQWLFLELYKKGLAYRKEAMVNWCPQDKTVLANEQVVDGCCERCGTEVTKKSLRQWFFKITEYAEELLDFSDIEWADRVKTMQKNWIGKSEGLLFTAPVKDMDMTIQTYSTHFEACYADTFVVIAPDHPLLPELLEGIENKDAVLAFAEELVKKRIARGFEEEKEPEGMFTGRYIVDPLGNGDLPIWIASFALADYGTGIVKCSAHDERDFRFAKKYNIPLKVGLVPPDAELRKKVENFEVCYTDHMNGILLEPAELAGQVAHDVRQKVVEHVETKGYAVRKTTYRLRDWLISRQRYWGAPIPIIYCDECGEVPVPTNQLPVVLPHNADFQPGGESPLARDESFVRVNCPKCGDLAKRETDTMDTFVDSSWYFLRFCDPKNESKAFDLEKVQYWMPVDLYIGGIEHAILHLLYARFFTKALADIGLFNFREPFKQLLDNGMIYLDGKKMSKSKGNVVNPDDLVARYGADTLRGYEMFIGPANLDVEWNPNGVAGVYRFLHKAWQFVVSESSGSTALSPETHKLIKKVTADFKSFSFNTVVSSLMSYVNNTSDKALSVADKKSFIQLMAPIFPHFSEELWQTLGEAESVFRSSWPTHDEAQLQTETATIIVQVNGKVKGTVTVDTRAEEAAVVAVVRADPKLQTVVPETVVRIIYVTGRLINFVVR